MFYRPLESFARPSAGAVYVFDHLLKSFIQLFLLEPFTCLTVCLIPLLDSFLEPVTCLTVSWSLYSTFSWSPLLFDRLPEPFARISLRALYLFDGLLESFIQIFHLEPFIFSAVWWRTLLDHLLESSALYIRCYWSVERRFL